jgi:hypothetical protein
MSDVTLIRLPFSHPHIVKRAGGWGMSVELARWLNDIEEQPKFINEDIRAWVDSRNDEMEFMFWIPEVAMMFKLAWVGV